MLRVYCPCRSWLRSSCLSHLVYRDGLRNRENQPSGICTYGIGGSRVVLRVPVNPPA